jgi:hypothetical protein
VVAALARNAHILDEWLHENFGRAYYAILVWGLVASILGGLSTLGRALSSFGIITLVFQGALLVNQLAQWHELRERRRSKAVRPGQPPASRDRYS